MNLLFLLFSLSSFLLVTATTRIILAQTPVPVNFCGGCIAFEAAGGSATWSPADCTSRVFQGVSGELAIVRSAEAMSVISTLTSGRPALLGGSDLAERGVWVWNATGEVIFSNSTRSASKFAYNNFERNKSNSNDYYEPPKLDETTNRIIAMESDSTWRAGPIVSATPRTILCSYHLPAVESLLHTNKSAVAEQDSFYHIADFEVVPEHVSHDVAYHRCLGLQRPDPATGQAVSGRLAVLLFQNESQTIVDLLRKKSDVPLHSNASDFGVWLGANWTKTGGTGIVDWSTGGPTGGSLFQAVNDGVCQSFMFCDEFEAAASPTLASEGLFMKVNGNYQWAPQDTAQLMPFVCEFRFSPNSTIKAPSLSRGLRAVESAASTIADGYPLAVAEAKIAGLNENSTAWLHPMDVPRVSVYTARYFHEWLSFSAAQAACEASSVTNEAGDTSSGELATALNAAEAEALRKLAVGSRVPELAPGDAANFGGAWIGLSNAVADTFAGASALSAQLKWGNSKLAFDNTVAWSYPAYSAADTCQASGACRPLRLTPSAGTGHAAVAYNGQDDSGFGGWAAVATTASNKRPYLCSYRFPLRVNISEQGNIVEYYPTPMAHAAAEQFCATRSLDVTGPGGAPFRGSLGFLPESVYGRVSQFLSSSTRNVFFDSSSSSSSSSSSQVYVGTKFSPPNSLVFHCLVHTTTSSSSSSSSTFTWEGCDTPRPFICLFGVRGASRSVTKTKSGGGNVSSTISRGSATDSHNATLSGERSISVSDADNSSTKTPAMTPPRTLTKQQTAPAPTTITTTTTTTAGPRTPTPVVVERTQTAILPPPPPPPKQKPAGRVVQEDIGVASSIVAIAGGGGVVAVQQQRLNLANALSSCGTGDELGDDPGFMGSPLRWKLGNETDILAYSRGMMVGNFVVILIVGAVMMLIALIYSAATNPSPSSASSDGAQNPLMRGILRTRMPGALIIPYQILLPPTAQHVAILFANATNAGDVFYGLFGLVFMVALPIAVTVHCAMYIKRGKSTLYFNDKEEVTIFAKKHPAWAASCIYRGFNYLTESLFEYRDTKEDDDDDEMMMMMDVKTLLSDDVNLGGDQNEPLLKHNSGNNLDSQDNSSGNLLAADAASSVIGGGGGGGGGGTIVTQESEQKQREEDEKVAPNHSAGMRVRRAQIKSYKSNPDALALLVDSPHFAMLGLIYEDYSHIGAPVMEVAVSTVLGMTAGGAMGRVSFGACVSICVINVSMSLCHFLYTSIFRGINPRLVLYFAVSTSAISFVAVSLAFTKYLLSALDFDSAFTTLGLIQAALGMMTAVLGFIGFVNFCYQLFDAFYLRTSSKQINTDGSPSTATGISKPGNLDLINIEEELAELERQQEAEREKQRLEDETRQRQRQEQAAREEQERQRAIEAEQEELRRRQKEQEEMNQLLQEAEAEADRRLSSGKYALDEDFGDLDDGDDDEMRRKMNVGRNSELDRRQEELQMFLSGKSSSGGGGAAAAAGASATAGSSEQYSDASSLI